MSIVSPGADTRHIIQKAINSKGLGTLAREEDTYQATKNLSPEEIKERNSVPPKRMRHIYSKADLQDFIMSCKDKSNDEIFEELGITVKYKEDGTKAISHYGWPFSAFSFQSAKINEEELLKDVSQIVGSCDLIGSSAKNLGGVTSIAGDLRIPLFTKVEDLSHIKTIGGAVVCETENPEDVSAVIDKVKLNPNILRQGVNPNNGSYYPIFSLPSGMVRDMRMMSYKNAMNLVK